MDRAAGRRSRMPPDPFQERAALRERGAARVKVRMPAAPGLEVGKSAVEIIHTALCVQARGGKLYVFFPPLTGGRRLDRSGRRRGNRRARRRCRGARRLFAALRSAPTSFAVTPDPGVIEVNIHPASSWEELATTPASSTNRRA